MRVRACLPVNLTGSLWHHVSCVCHAACGDERGSHILPQRHPVVIQQCSLSSLSTVEGLLTQSIPRVHAQVLTNNALDKARSLCKATENTGTAGSAFFGRAEMSEGAGNALSLQTDYVDLCQRQNLTCA